MPTAPYYAALFAAGPEIWQYPTWQERTKYIVPPFSSEATPALTGLSDHEISLIKALAGRTHHLTKHAEVMKVLNTERDNDTMGKRAWDAWAARNFDNWSLKKDLEIVLMEEGRHPRQLIGTQGFVSALGMTIDVLTILHTGKRCPHHG
jgi:hypothetical protein